MVTSAEAKPAIRTQILDRRLSFLLDFCLLTAIPLVQAMINDTWLFTPAGWLDSWYYLGYGLNYTDPTYLNDYYKVSRLPWILVEFVARGLFSAVVASWVLQIGTLVLGSCSLYLLFSRTLGRSAAFVGAAVFAAFPFGHSSGGADYQNVLAGPLYALTWWLAIRCAELEECRKRLFWVGVTAALTLHSSIVFASLIPVLAGHYVWTYRDTHRTWPRIIQTVVPVLTGAVAITLLLCIINAVVGRDFFFFMRQFDLATSFILDTFAPEVVVASLVEWLVLDSKLSWAVCRCPSDCAGNADCRMGARIQRQPNCDVFCRLRRRRFAVDRLANAGPDLPRLVLFCLPPRLSVYRCDRRRLCLLGSDGETPKCRLETRRMCDRGGRTRVFQQRQL